MSLPESVTAGVGAKRRKVTVCAWGAGEKEVE